MQTFIRLIFLLVLSISLLEASVGKITALSGKASLERGSSIIPVTLGLSLEAKDTIVTSNDAKAQLTFNDNTIITVGKKSKFSIEEYLFDATTESTAKFNMVNGTIRAMSGKIGKIAPDRFAVKTKTATIGIRGTDFIIQTSENGDSQFFCMQGAITIRSNDGEMIIIPAGSYVTISPSGIISEIKEFTPDELNTLLKNSLSVTTVHTNEEITQIDSDSVIDFVSQTSPTLNPDESLDRGSSVNIESLITEVGTTTGAITENLDNPIDMTPKTFTGVMTSIFRYPGGYNYIKEGSLALTSDPSTQTVTGDIDVPAIYSQIHLGATTSYSGINAFDVQLTSIEDTSTITPFLSGSYLRACACTSTDDYFAWGEWEKILDNSNPSDYYANGYWAAGVETPASVIDGFRSASLQMTYSGSVIGEIQHFDSSGAYLSTNSMSAGIAQIDVDFGQDTFNASFDFSAGNAYQLVYNGNINIDTNKLNSWVPYSLADDALTTFTSTSGSLNGGFYGSDGKTVGGTFNASSNIGVNSIMIQGAFKATAP
jgi:hypothetical protein